MELQAIYARVQGDIGDEGGIFIRQQHVTDWVNSAIKDIYSKSEFGRSDLNYYVFASGEPYWQSEDEYSHPSQLRRIHLISIDGVPLKEITPQYLLEHIYSHDDVWAKEGLPRYYWRENIVDRATPSAPDEKMNVSVRLWPIPDKEYEAVVSHVLNPVTLTDPSDDTNYVLPDHFEEDIILYCVAKSHAKNKDYEGSVHVMDQYNTRRDERFREAHELEDDFMIMSPDEMDYLY